MKKFITEKPSFDALFEMKNDLQAAEQMVSSLADEGDTIQRATDLFLHIKDIYDKAKAILTE